MATYLHQPRLTNVPGGLMTDSVPRASQLQATLKLCPPNNLDNGLPGLIQALFLQIIKAVTSTPAKAINRDGEIGKGNY